MWTTAAGRTLHTLRVQLLDAVAARTPAGGSDGDEQDERESPVPRHEFLKLARESAERGESETLTVRDLVRHWGARTRGANISRHIEIDLVNHGLTTDPNFLNVTLDDEVALLAVQPEPVAATATAADNAPAVDSVVATVIPADTGERREIGMKLGNLTPRWRTLVSVKPTATVAEAMTKMLVNDFSQLPVLKSKHTLDGAVTWQSMARARLKDPDAPLSAAIVPATKLPYDHDLHTVLPTREVTRHVSIGDWAPSSCCRCSPRSRPPPPRPRPRTARHSITPTPRGRRPR